MILRSHKVPPADAATAIALLGIQAEAQHVAELGEVVYDFVGESSPTEPTTALLMGLSRRCLDRVLAMGSGAGLKVVGVTPCTAALATATAARCHLPLVLSVRSEGGELAAADGSQPLFLRHLGSAVSAPSLGTELRRAAALLPARFGAGNGHVPAQGNGQTRMVLWDDVGLDAPAIQLLQDAVGIPVIRGELSALGGTGCALADGRVGGQAVALAIPLLERRRPAIDFLHPRLVPPKPSRIPRRALWFSVSALVALLVLGAGYADLSRLQRQVGDLDGQLKQLAPALGPARPFVTRMKFAESFRGGDPRVLACLRDLTTALPPGDQTYLTGFRLQDNMQGEVSGRSGSAQDLIKMVDSLIGASRFTDIKRSLDGRGATAGVSFKVTFTYAPRR